MQIHAEMNEPAAVQACAAEDGNIRKIIHVDMDAFFASVEQLDAPRLRGRPVIVGGDPRSRGVVAACSYEARRFGVRSAMSCARAAQLCPEAVFVRPRRQRYVEISRQIMALFAEYTDLVEPLSVDEAFLDITVNRLGMRSATWAAEAIRQEIFRRTGLTASAGVSYNKFLAKVASDVNKPNGLTVITPEAALDFLRALPIERFYGVGRVTSQRMRDLGIVTGADLQRQPRQQLVHWFGKSGAFFHDMARGVDPRPVQPSRTRKSIGTETTLATDIDDRRQMLAILAEQADQLAASLERRCIGGRTLSLKVRYSDFTTVTRSCSTGAGFVTATEMLDQAEVLLGSTEAGRRKVRLLGLAVANLFERQGGRRWRQLPLPFPRTPRFRGDPDR